MFIAAAALTGAEGFLVNTKNDDLITCSKESITKCGANDTGCACVRAGESGRCQMDQGANQLAAGQTLSFSCNTGPWWKHLLG